MKQNELILEPDFSRKVAELYHEMETAYDTFARTIRFTCSGCPDNCCDSYFPHYTYTEWAYLWQGLKTLEKNRLQHVTEKAAAYEAESEKALAGGERPVIMCPLNMDGLCSLYPYRLMICRLHGVPASFTRPDGRRMNFPGCFRCQELIGGEYDGLPLDRTRFFRRMVDLETELLGQRRTVAPRVKMTIARMILEGPPLL